MNVTEQWHNYLTRDRGLSESVCDAADLSVDNYDHLVIPVKDVDGNTIFNKYRKAPWGNSAGPKYKYDKGSHVVLYNVQNIPAKTTSIIITEGEFDCMTLQKYGLAAVSSTGGAQSFQDSWCDWFASKQTTVWFDNDDAGISGAVKVAMKLGAINYAWTPPKYGNDINDVDLQAGVSGINDQLARAIPVTLPDFSTATNAEITHVVSWLKKTARAYNPNGTPFKFLTALISAVEEKKAPAKKANTYTGDDNLERAKAYPIENMLRVSQGFADHCPFHNPDKRRENSPSFKVYPNNTAYCFGACGRHYDAVDIYQQIHDYPHTKEGFKKVIHDMNQ